MLLVEDRALLEAFRRGEPAALERVFDHYYPELVSLLQGGFTFQSGGRTMRFSGCRDGVDLFDLVHEVFRAAFEQRAREGYGGLRPYGAYLHTIARNLAVTRLRRESAAPHIEPLDAAIAVPATTQSPEETAASAQERQVVQDFLATLDPLSREFMRLRFEEDLSQEAVADALGVGRKKVRLLEQQVRAGLRAHLDRRGIPPPAPRWETSDA